MRGDEAQNSRLCVALSRHYLQKSSNAAGAPGPAEVLVGGSDSLLPGDGTAGKACCSQEDRPARAALYSPRPERSVGDRVAGITR